jgi:hypothetical protein
MVRSHRDEHASATATSLYGTPGGEVSEGTEVLGARVAVSDRGLFSGICEK